MIDLSDLDEIDGGWSTAEDDHHGHKDGVSSQSGPFRAIFDKQGDQGQDDKGSEHHTKDNG